MGATLGPGRPVPAGFYALLLPAGCLVLAFHAVPILAILTMSVTEPTVGLGNWERLFTSRAAQVALTTTLRIGVVTTLVTVLLGYLYAYIAVSMPRPVERAMLLAAVATIWLSVLIRTIAWVIILRDNGILNQWLLAAGIIRSPVAFIRNDLGVVIGMVHYMLPLAILPIHAALKAVPERVVQSAEALGAGPFVVFRRVVLPLSRPGIVAATTVVFIFSLGFLVTPAILGGGKVIMVAEYIKLQFDETLRWGIAAMMATALLLSVLAVLVSVNAVVPLRSIFGVK